ncbi:hypothetical protein HB780_10435 (plasmid) [Rhizobium lusitanum]|uniref:hypothetical protein n=1 Tax=Rhizobium lusitanum TaxID=293958 RepID=UPI001613F5B0|nr:hypothetical protein [Rhizobium lusitanum]QND46087.1 hypothetical protein HB780_10435 [Rhizobium lusitanum]
MARDRYMRQPIHLGVVAASIILAVLIYIFMKEALAVTGEAEQTAESPTVSFIKNIATFSARQSGTRRSLW